MKKIFRKNQIIITVLALMIVIAGYLQFTGKGFGKDDEAKETTYDISGEDVFTVEDIFTDTEDNSDKEELNPGEAVLTGVNSFEIDYAAEMKMNREQMRSKNKETLMEVIDNVNITDEQKQEAIDSMIQLTDIAEKEAATEMLLEAKGFNNVVVSISGEAVDVVLSMGEITDAKLAQIEDIVKRKTEIAPENIVITPIQPEN